MKDETLVAQAKIDALCENINNEIDVASDLLKYSNWLAAVASGLLFLSIVNQEKLSAQSSFGLVNAILACIYVFLTASIVLAGGVYSRVNSTNSLRRRARFDQRMQSAKIFSRHSKGNGVAYIPVGDMKKLAYLADNSRRKGLEVLTKIEQRKNSYVKLFRIQRILVGLSMCGVALIGLIGVILPNPIDPPYSKQDGDGQARCRCELEVPMNVPNINPESDARRLQRVAGF